MAEPPGASRRAGPGTGSGGSNAGSGDAATESGGADTGSEGSATESGGADTGSGGPATALLRVTGLGKRFPGVRALVDVDLTLYAGEVLAVVGENGAGKSTLMKILAGVLPPDEGAILLDGQPIAFPNVASAQAAGVVLIPQERNLADNLSVGANVLLGREPHRFGLIDRRALRQTAARHLAAVGLDVDPDTPTAELSVGHQQLLEIAAALSADARVLIMDEPTSSLSAAESGRLLALVRDLTGRGVGVVYISHRLGEIEALADRALVLRDGVVVGELSAGAIDHQRLLKLMVGRDVVRRERRAASTPQRAASNRQQASPSSQQAASTHHAPPTGQQPEPTTQPSEQMARRTVALSVEGLVTVEHPDQVLDFRVDAGEIVGLAGLVGAGRSELLRALFGITPPRSGVVLALGQPLLPGGPVERMAAGLAYVPEERQRDGLALEMSLRENVSLSVLGRLSRAGFINAAAERATAAAARDGLGIRSPSIEVSVDSLSGGNQQKVMLARALATEPRVLLLDEPTRGVDVAAKTEIHRLIDELAARGVAVLFASSELEELLELADRVLVLRDGELVGELTGAALTEEAIGALATGAEVAA